MNLSWLVLASTALVLVLATACTATEAHGRQTKPPAAATPGAPQPTPGQPQAGPEPGSAVQPAPAQPQAGPQTEPAVQPTPPQPQARPQLESGLVDELREMLHGREGTYGVLVEDVALGASFAHNHERVFPAASVYKLAVAYEVLRRADEGELSLHDPITIEPTDVQEPEPAGGVAEHEQLSVAEALERMMAVSSNACAHALLRHVGRATLNQSLAEIGMHYTRVPVREPDSLWTGLLSHEAELVPPMAETSPQDMALLLRLLATEELLSDASLQVLRELLALEEPRDPLVNSLPLHVAVLSKAGELEDATNVAGLIETPVGPVIVAVFSEQAGPGVAAELIAAVGRSVYRYYFDDQRSSG